MFLKYIFSVFLMPILTLKLVYFCRKVHRYFFYCRLLLSSQNEVSQIQINIILNEAKGVSLSKEHRVYLSHIQNRSILDFAIFRNSFFSSYFVFFDYIKSSICGKINLQFALNSIEQHCDNAYKNPKT